VKMLKPKQLIAVWLEDTKQFVVPPSFGVIVFKKNLNFEHILRAMMKPETLNIAQRKFRRFDLQMPVELTSGHENLITNTMNVSAGGLFVYTHAGNPVANSMNLNGIVEIKMQLAQRNYFIETSAEVRWKNTGRAMSNQPTGLGLQFVDLSSNDRIHLLKVFDEVGQSR
jgi:c-di-GMP-binding flagellar brake protein YcgR